MWSRDVTRAIPSGSLTCELMRGGLLALCAACSSAPPVDVSSPPVATVADASTFEPFPTALGEPRYKRVLSQRFQLSVPLPDRAGWRMVREKKSSFLVLDHAATSSRLVLRLWREGDNMDRQRCEERSRLIRDMPVRGRPIDSRVIQVPQGFDTIIDVGFSATQPGDPIGGYVLAFGAEGRRCFGFTYDTQASGGDAERIVGDRLAVIQSLTLEGIELRGVLNEASR